MTGIVVFSLIGLFVVGQLILGAAMVATASVAANRHVNTPSRTLCTVLAEIAWLSISLGVCGILAATVGMNLQGPFTAGTAFGIALAVIYSGLYLVGGRLQLGAASALLTPPSLEEQRKRDWRIPTLRAVGLTLALWPIGIFVALYAGVSAFFGRTVRVQQESLLWILAIATRTKAPLSEEIEMLADSSRGRFRGRLRALARRLRNGEGLADALDDLPGLVPRETATAIRLGENLGNLVPVLQYEAIRLRKREVERVQGRLSATGVGFYGCTFLMTAGMIVGFLAYWIVPKFKKIFQDFRTEIPAATSTMIGVVEFVAAYAPLIIVCVGLLVLWPVFRQIRRNGWAGFDGSFLGVLLPRIETAGILRGLSSAVAARRPLSDALEGLALHHRNWRIRRRFARVRDAVRQGRGCFEPLYQCGVVNAAEAAALVAAERVGNLAWALDSIAETIEQRRRTRMQAMADVVQPGIVIALGLFVLSICLGMFLPLVKLIGEMG